MIKPALFLSILLVIFSCGRKAETDSGETEPGIENQGPVFIHLTPEQMDMAEIELGQPQMRAIASYVECTGTVEVPPQSLASVYSPVSGFVKVVRFLPGDYVKKGTLLATIAHPDLIRRQREFLESKSRLTPLEQDFRRKETLAGSDATSQRALEQARAEFEMEKARYNGLKAELKLIGFAVGQLENDGTIQSTLDLHAPVSGFINKVNLNIGKLISPDDLLYEIIDNSHVHLELKVFAKDIDKVKKDQLIEAWMPGSDSVFQAEVHLVGKMIDPDTKTALVHGHFFKEPVPLTPGTYMHAHVYVDSRQVLAVPETAIVRKGKEAFVFVRKNDGFGKVRVRPGMTDGDWVEIDPVDLPAGEMVVLKGAYYIEGSVGEE